MPTYLAPGVFMEERVRGARPIAGVSTSTAAFVGVAERGPVGKARLVTNVAEFTKYYGGRIPVVVDSQEHYLATAVRHFFALGGTRCYVVRVAHYSNINDPLTSTAASATAAFDAQQVSGATVAGALGVEAISPGTWGTGLQVEVASTSRFQLSLAENIAAGNFTSINLQPNSDVVAGSVLYLVHEIRGVVQTVDTTAKTVVFAGPLMEGATPAPSGRTIAAATAAFKPDFSLLTAYIAAGTPVDLSLAGNNPPAAAMQLDSVDGLQPGDALHFVVTHAIVVVTTTEATTVAGNPAMKATIGTAAVALPALPKNETRVYARDFALRVRLGGAGGEIVETHANLSLVPADTANYVTARLGPDSGHSNYIVAEDPSPAAVKTIVMRNTAFTALGGSPSDGLTDLSVTDFIGSDPAKNGLHALDAIYDFSILAVPPSRLTPAAQPNPLTNQEDLTKLTIAWVENRRDVFYVIDPPRTAGSTPVAAVRTFTGKLSSSYAALYFPWLTVRDEETGHPVHVPPSGAVAGVYARSDGKRGVHKAPAGFEVGPIPVASGLAHLITRGENDLLYPERINAIRSFTDGGIVVWGSRTISAEPLWQQVSIRRLFLYLERSIELGTQWVVFEPNDPQLWKSIERSVRSFLRVQWLDGLLVGEKEEHAFFVHCNAETNPPEVVEAGQVVTEIGVAPSRPAEFVVFRIRQFTGPAV